MTDFNFVTDRIATGAAIQSADDVQAIIAAGITHIVDATDAYDDTIEFAKTGVAVLWNPTADDGQTKPPEWFARSLLFALPALAQPHMKVYVHCSAGVNRGPSTCFAILLALGFSPEEAETQIRKARPQVGLAYKQDAITAVPLLGY